MSQTDLVGHHMEGSEGTFQIIAVNHLIVVTVHDEVDVVHLGDIGRDAQILTGIEGNLILALRDEVRSGEIEFHIGGAKIAFDMQGRRVRSRRLRETGGLGLCGKVRAKPEENGGTGGQQNRDQQDDEFFGMLCHR